MQYISGEARKPSIFVSSTCYDLNRLGEILENLLKRI